MGLPIWRDPDESKAKAEVTKPDPTASARSPIRRRPSVHSRRINRTRVAAVPRETTLSSPRPERSISSSTGANWLRASARDTFREVPPVSTLLEFAEQPPRPPPLPTQRRGNLIPGTYVDGVASRTLDSDDRHVSNIARIQAQSRLLGEEARQAQSRLVATNAGILHLTRSPSPMLGHQSGNEAAVRRAQISAPFRETMHATRRPHSRNGRGTHRNTLPTPPLDHSENMSSETFPGSDTSRALHRHPLSRQLRPDSPINGLGDRVRSPTPGETWEIMRTTITPDATLPSAESSFVSAAASADDLDRVSVSSDSRRDSADGNRSDSVSSVDPEDLCNDEERELTAAYALDMYYQESQTPDGMARIMRHEGMQEIEGNRYALVGEQPHVEIGFRLIDQALDTPEGRGRVYQLDRIPRRHIRSGDLEELIFSNRREHRRARPAHITDDAPPSPHPEEWSEEARTAVREATVHVHDYFRRFEADRLASEQSRPAMEPRPTSPPPRYEPLASHPDVNTFTSRDAPEAFPVSPPSARVERDIGETLLSGDESDLNAVRRVVERLAQRDDVPDEWWMSMGLNLSRTRARSRTPPPSRRQMTVDDPLYNDAERRRRESQRREDQERAMAELELYERSRAAFQAGYSGRADSRL